MTAPKGPWAWKCKGKKCRQWILFNHMKGLKIQGSGSINGQGTTWWHLSCKDNKRVYIFFYEIYSLIFFFNLNFLDELLINLFDFVFELFINFLIVKFQFRFDSVLIFGHSLAGLWKKANCK